VNRLWKFFISVKLTVVVLLSLAATSIIGTLIPQNEPAEAYRQAFGDFFYRLFDVLDIFDMYHSWWFRLLVAMLAVNIVACSIERLSSTWKILFPRVPPFRMGKIRKTDNQQAFNSPTPPPRLLESFRRHVGRGFRYLRVEEEDSGYRILAERRRWTRAGVYVVHTSVVLLLAGGLIGSFFGFEGYVNIPEGEATDTIRLRNSDQMIRLPFAIRCDDFDVSFYPSGAPKEFRSSLTLLQDGKPLLSKDIIVNDPLRHAGINIFQSSYGRMPGERMQQATRPPPESITLQLTSTETGMAYEETVEMGQTFELPEGAGTFQFKEYQPAATFMGQNIGEALIGHLTPAEGKPSDVLLPLRFANFDKMRRGRIVISVVDVQPEASDTNLATPPRQRWYTGLQVTSDPGVWVVYLGFVLMLTGCFITFFLSHQQIVVEVVPKEEGSRVTVYGVANRNRIGYRRRIEAISGSLSGIADNLESGGSL